MSEKSNEQGTLRKTSGAQLAYAPDMAIPVRSAEELLRELQAYQIKLEMQNEQLRQAQMALEESHNRYVCLYDFAPVGYLTLNHEGLIDEINLTAAALLGVERSKLRHRHFASFVAMEHGDRWYRHFLSVLEYDSKLSCELALLRGDGSSFYVQLDSLRADDSINSCEPEKSPPMRLKNEGKEPVVRIALTDITKRKAVEDAIEESSRFFSRLAQISPVGIYRTDAQGNCVYVSDCWSKITGMTPAKALGGGWAQAIHQDDRERVAQAWYASTQTHQNFIMEHRMQRPNGVTRWVLGQAVAERNVAGEVVGYIGTVTDITQSKQLEEARQEALDCLQKIASQVPGVVFQLRLRPDGSSCIPYASDAMREIYRLNPEEVREDAAKVFTHVCPDDLGKHLASIQASARDLTPWQQEYRLIFDDGTVHWLFGNALPQREADGSTLWHGFITDITGSVHAKNTLHKSDERWKFALEGAGDGVFDWNLQTGEGEYSERWKEIFGFDGKSFIEWSSRVHPEDMPGVMATIQAHLDGKTPTAVSEFRIWYKDVIWKWILVRGMLVSRDTDGKPLRLIGTGTDITERKENEENLRHSKEKLRAYLDNISDTIWLIDANLNMAYVSSGVTRLLGVSPEELIGRPSALVIHPDDMNIVTDAQRYVMERPGAPHTIQYRISHKDGRWIHVESTGIDMLDNPAINGVLVTMRDITGRKQVENALRLSEENLNRAQAIAQVGSWILDIPTGRLEWSAETYRMFNLPQQEAIDQAVFAAIVHPDDRDFVFKAWGEAMAGGGDFDIEHRIVVDGQVRWMRERARIEHDSKGRPIAGIGTVQDITERKQMEQKQRNLAAHLQSVREEEKTSIAREIHDDLGGTLTALKMETHWLKIELSGNEEATLLLDHVVEMSQLIDNAAGTIQSIITGLRPTILDDLGLLAAIEWQAAQFQKHIGIECRVNRVCAKDEDCATELDKPRSIALFRILQEALTNVKKHSGASCVEIEFLRNNAEVVMSVIDNGRGMTENPTITPMPFGILGMQERTNQLGGTINFGTSPGGGFSVTVILPLPENEEEGA